MDAYLDATGKSAATKKMYTSVVRLVEASGKTPEAWLEGKVSAQTPKRSIAVYRGAITAYHAWKHWKSTGVDMGDEEKFLIGKRLTPTRKGRKGMDRDAPTPEQFQAFCRLVEEVEDPERTILKLLPHTGLRISEACSLQQDSIREQHGRFVLAIVGKGNKSREVPMSMEAQRILADYLDREDPPKPWIFWRRASETIEPRPSRTYEVEKVMQAIREKDANLDGVVPHSFRHLFASAAIKGGVDVRTVQKYLGHENLSTTMRYMHPDFDMLGGGADTVSGVLLKYTKTP